MSVELLYHTGLDGKGEDGSLTRFAFHLILPCINLISFSEMASPRPVPPYLRVVDVSTCENALNSRFNLSAGMPIRCHELQTLIPSALLAKISTNEHPQTLRPAA